MGLKLKNRKVCFLYFRPRSYSNDFKHDHQSSAFQNHSPSLNGNRKMQVRFLQEAFKMKWMLGLPERYLEKKLATSEKRKNTPSATVPTSNNTICGPTQMKQFNQTTFCKVASQGSIILSSAEVSVWSLSRAISNVHKNIIILLVVVSIFSNRVAYSFV